MTTVRINPVTDGTGDVVPAEVSVRLVDADGTDRVGWQVSTGDPVTEYSLIPLTEAGGAIDLELFPQVDVAYDAYGSPTYYRCTIATAHRSEPYDVQVPDTAEVVGLADLVGQDLIDGGVLVYDRLLTVDERAGFDQVADPIDAANPPLTEAALVGVDTIAVVSSLPDPQAAGTLYFVTP